MRHIILLFLAVAVSSAADAQSPFWQQCPGPSGGTIVSVAADTSGGLYVLAHRVWYSPDRGASWQDITGTLPLGHLRNILVAENGDIYVGEYWDGSSGGPVTHPRSLYRTRDRGKKWDTLHTWVEADGLRWGPNGMLMLVGSANSDSQHWFFLSNDSGRTWTPMQNLPYDWHHEFFSFDRRGNLYASSTNAFFRSVDTGKTWAKMPCIELASGPLAEMNDSSFVAYGNYGGYAGLWRSTDRGMNWDTICSGSGPAWTVTPNDEIFTQRGQRILHSTDHGASWQDAGKRTYNFFRESLLPNPSGGVIFFGSDSIVLSDPAHKTFAAMPVASESDVFTMTEMQAGPIYGWADHHGVVSWDGGKTWGVYGVDYSVFHWDDIYSVVCDSSNALVAAAAHDVARSIDAGGSWTTIRANVTTWGGYTSLCVSSAGSIFVATPSSGLQRSTDQGQTWTTISAFGFAQAQCVTATSGGSVYVSADNFIYRSSDDGNSWQKAVDLRDTSLHLQYTDLPRASVMVGSGRHSIVAGTAGYGAIRSTDDGLTWKAVNENTANGNFSKLAAAPGGNVYAIVRLGDEPLKRVMILPPTRSKWFDASDSVNRIDDLQALAVAPDGAGIVGTNGRGFFRQVRAVDAAPIINLTRDTPALSVFPNPATDHSTVRYGLSERGFVRLELVDVLGRTLRTLASATQEAGEYAVSASLAGVSAGTIFVRLATDRGSVIVPLAITH